MRPYKYSYLQKDEIEVIVQEILASRVIQPNQNPYFFPVLLVKKADRMWRLRVDYMRLNGVTIKDKFPIPA